MELKQYWQAVRRRMGLIVALIVLSGAAAGYYSYSVAVKQYAASAKLIVNASQRLNVTQGTLDLGTINSNIQLAKTYKEIIRTPRIMKLVEEQYPNLGLSSIQLTRMITVSTVNETQVMSITATDTSYRRAAEAVNAVAAVFKSEIPNLMKIDNVNILNEADPDAAAMPVSPSPVRNIAMSVLLAAVIGLALALLLDYLDDSFKSQKEVEEALGLATFAVVPRMKTGGAGSRLEDRNQPIRGGENAALEL